ncbi:AAA family ATPase [Acinetobacter nosocomialis]
MRWFKADKFYIWGKWVWKNYNCRIIDQPLGYTHCLLQWLGEEPIKTLVYNKDFIDRNFNQENTVKGVFTLGDDQVEAEGQIALLRPQMRVNGSVKNISLNIVANGVNYILV